MSTNQNVPNPTEQAPEDRRYLIPQSVEDERSILIDMFADPVFAHEAGLALLTPDFRDERHRHIFNALCEGLPRNETSHEAVIDRLHLTGRLRRAGGKSYIRQLCPSASADAVSTGGEQHGDR